MLLASALPEPVVVVSLPESGEDEAKGTEPFAQREPVFDQPAPSSPSDAAEHRSRERPLTGLPWDDLAPDRDTVVPEPAATVSQPALHSTVAAESAPIGFDEPPAASVSGDYLDVVDGIPGEIAVETGGEILRKRPPRTRTATAAAEEARPSKRSMATKSTKTNASIARHTRHYKIQEVVKRRQICLSRCQRRSAGTKGAALPPVVASRAICVLMPNTARPATMYRARSPV